jgi:hypothetical protein
VRAGLKWIADLTTLLFPEPEPEPEPEPQPQPHKHGQLSKVHSFVC